MVVLWHTLSSVLVPGHTPGSVLVPWHTLNSVLVPWHTPLHTLHQGFLVDRTSLPIVPIFFLFLCF